MLQGENQNLREKWFWLIIGILIILLLFSIATNQFLSKQIQTLEKQIAKVSMVSKANGMEKEEVVKEKWQLIKKIEGAGDKKSEVFVVDKNEWRIEWNVQMREGENNAPLFEIGLFEVGESEPVKVIQAIFSQEDLAEGKLNFSDVVDCASQGQGEFFLDIKASENISGWKIEIRGY